MGSAWQMRLQSLMYVMKGKATKIAIKWWSSTWELKSIEEQRTRIEEERRAGRGERERDEGEGGRGRSSPLHSHSYFSGIPSSVDQPGDRGEDKRWCVLRRNSLFTDCDYHFECNNILRRIFIYSFCKPLKCLKFNHNTRPIRSSFSKWWKSSVRARRDKGTNPRKQPKLR